MQKSVSSGYQIILHSLFFLFVLTYSIPLVTIQGQAQQPIITNSKDQPRTDVDLINRVPTVRVNNLCNLEAVLFYVVNIVQYGSIISGAILIWHSRMKSDLIVPIFNLKLTRRIQLIIGCGLIVLGFSLPAILNWLIQG
jgi:hypothetical protein